MLKHASKLFAIAAVAASISFVAEAQTVTKTISLPHSSFGGIVANPFTDKIYAVSNSGSATAADTVSVIDGKTDTIVASIAVPSGAYIPALNPLTNKLYVASCNFFVNPSPCFVTVVDTRTNTVVASIPVIKVLNGFFAGIVVNPITNKIYVSDNTRKEIVVIDGGTNTVTDSIALAQGPWGMAINPFTNKLYVTLGNSTLDIVDAASKDILAVDTGAGTIDFNVAVDLLTSRVYVTNTQFAGSTLAVLNRDGHILAQVPVGHGAYGVDVDPFSFLTFTSNSNDNSTSVVNALGNTLKGTIVSTFSTFTTVNPATRKVYGIGAGAVTVAME
jgi:YVTN family beta-propeller protein